MSTGKTLEYVKRWKALEAQRNHLDYELSRWCSDLRTEFSPGSDGDAKLRKWIDVELGLAPHRKEEIVARAAAFHALPDRAEYEGLGGFQHARRLLPLNKRERVSAIGEAKSSGKLLGSVIRDREAARRRREPAPRAPRIFPVTVHASEREYARWRAAADGQDLDEWLKALGNAAAAKK